MSEKITREKTCRECNKTFIDTMEKHPVLGWPAKPSTFKQNNSGLCKACYKAIGKRIELRENIQKLFWTPETIKNHFENHIPVTGQDLILLYTGYAPPNQVSYTLVKVESVQIKPRRKLIINSAPPHVGRVFLFSGKNTFAPKGQSLLLPYHKALGEIIAEKGRPVFKEQEIPVKLQVTLEELEAILGDQDGPMAD